MSEVNDLKFSIDLFVEEGDDSSSAFVAIPNKQFFVDCFEIF